MDTKHFKFFSQRDQKMVNFLHSDDNPMRLEAIPSQLPILPLRNTVAYPFCVMPLSVGIPRSVKLVEDALQKKSFMGLVSVKDSSIEEAILDQIYEIVTLSRRHWVL